MLPTSSFFVPIVEWSNAENETDTKDVKVVQSKVQAKITCTEWHIVTELHTYGNNHG